MQGGGKLGKESSRAESSHDVLHIWMATQKTKRVD